MLLRVVRRQRARPAIRAKGHLGVCIIDDEVDALLRSHGEIDYEAMVDGLDDAIAASSTLRDDENGCFARLRRSFHLDGDDADLLFCL